MPGLMARILSRRAAGAPPPMPEPTETSATDEPAAPLPAGPEQHTAVLPAVERSPELEETGPVDAAAPSDDDAAAAAEGDLPESPTLPEEPGNSPVETAPAEPPGAETLAPDPAVPAGADGPPPSSPTVLARGKLRRRLRYLRRVREIGFRDLGGLVFDLDRFGRERPDLVELKLTGLRAIDAELRELEVALADLRDSEELFEPGISACARCGALHGSEARFCPACGAPVDATTAPVELPSAAPQPPPRAGADPAPPAACPSPPPRSQRR